VFLNPLCFGGFIFYPHLSGSCAGKAESGGRMHVTLCDYIMLWDNMSPTQKKSLTQRYQMGCECKVGAECAEERFALQT
jgi:hypothetical protein